jgi:hypothetical protein
MQYALKKGQYVEKLHTLYLSQIVVLEAINKVILIFDSAPYLQHGSHTADLNYMHIKSSNKRIMSIFKYKEFIKQIKECVFKYLFNATVQYPFLSVTLVKLVGRLQKILMP